MSKTVKIKWSPRSKNWYINKGYEFTKWKDEFEVKIEDLSNGSNLKVNVQCDGCGKILTGVKWSLYKKSVKKDGKYYCLRCARNGFKKYTSFYEWCYSNLSKEDAEELLLRWDYNKNALSPKEVSCKSVDLNGKGYWFRCLTDQKHVSEQKNISSFIRGCKGSIDCNQCNSISNNYPHLTKYLVNKEDAFKYSMGSNKKIPMKCPDCGYEKQMMINTLRRNGFACPRCSDGISYPEKFIFALLEQINTNFKTQLNNKTFSWCDKYLYDFYLSKFNCIIETHGLQHYEEFTGWGSSLNEVQKNDERKKKIAKNNNIENYIILNCKYSYMEWIKNSVMNSNLPKLLGFKEKDINWLKCHEYACSSMVKTVCECWNNNEIKNTFKIAEELKIGKSSVIRYLKQGVKLGWSDYNPHEERIKNHCKQIKCLTTGEIFKSMTQASLKYKMTAENISMCCRNKTKSAGKHPITGEKLIWMFYDEWLEQQGTEIPANIQNPIKRGIDKVI